MADVSKLLPLLDTAEPAALGPGPREGIKSVSTLNTELDELVSDTGLDKERQQLVRSLVLLWHDHLEASHALSQKVETADGSYVHGIMHRREPDYGNAKYWFRKVGQHPVFASLVAGAGEILRQKHREDLQEVLMPGNRWDALAMVDLCQAATGKAEGDPLHAVAQDLQTLEFRVLLSHFTR